MLKSRLLRWGGRAFECPPRTKDPGFAGLPGSQAISGSPTEIAEKGANSTNELLGLIPQIANQFNGRFEADPRGIQGSGTSVTRPNLRNLPSSNTTSGALTLVLADGFRMTPVGVNQASVDPDIVPAAIIAGIDVVTDGGSSLHGADAVAGVLNFRTLRKFDQVKAAAGGKAIDVVFDPVGGAVTEPAFRSLGWNGRHLVVGFTAGIAQFRTNLALLKGASLVGVDLPQFGVNEPEAAQDNMRAVFALAEAGVLKPAIARTYPLEEFRAAMDDAASGVAAGRVVVAMV